MKREILRLLIKNRDRFISGEEISNRMGVSRTAVWKQINNLKEDGYKIDSAHRQGYKLIRYSDMINKDELLLKTGERLFGRAIHVYDEVLSTNDVAKKLAAAGAPEGTVVIAERQSRGKGRLGRSWIAPVHKGLLFSFVLKPSITPAVAVQLIFVSAVAVCRALRGFTGLDVKIKWPNDLVIEGKKVGGILTELSAEIDLINYVVVGVGINTNNEADDFPADIAAKASSLALAAGRSFRRTDLLVAIFTELEAEYSDYVQMGFTCIVERWKGLTSTLGQEVLVSTGEETLAGLALDIDETGCLLVKKTDGSITRVIVGDVSVRGKDGSYI